MPVSSENCQEGRGGAQECIVLTRTYMSEVSEVLGSGNQGPPWFNCSRVSGEPVLLGRRAICASLTSCLALSCPAQVESRAPDSERWGGRLLTSVFQCLYVPMLSYYCMKAMKMH